jgi:hypothetical protein
MRDVFWPLYLLNVSAVAVFGVGMYGLLRPQRLLVAYRWTWERSAQLARSPAILDETEARYVGIMFVLAATILAGAAVLTI